MKKRVLVVDDCEQVGELIEDILSSRNYQVFRAENGAEGIHLYSKMKPDVVFLDVMMPLMDGLETLTKLLKIDKNAKIIMLSALEDDELVHKCLRKGAVAYLTKPFITQEIIDAINEVSSPTVDKHLKALFHLATNRIFRSLKKIDSESSISLGCIELLEQEKLPQQFPLNMDYNIRAVPKTISQLKVNSPSLECEGFVTEFTGSSNGLIISFIDKEKLPLLLGDGANNCAVIEFFNIFNMKILAEFTTKLKGFIEFNPPRIYDATYDGDLSFNHIAKAKFQITYNNTAATVETDLCLKEEQSPLLPV